MPRTVDVNEISKWIAAADEVFKTPLVREVVWPMVKAMLPPFGVSEKQIAELDARHADAVGRLARARKRSGRG